MPRTPNPVPVYRRHKASKQAVCTVRLASGKAKDIYLGKWNSAASKAEYNRVVAIVAAAGGIYPEAALDFTINEALVRYVRFIDGHYVDRAGNPTGTATDMKVALGYLKRLFGPTPLANFGPPQLKAVRAVLVDDGRVRIQVNKRCSQIRQFFKWCVEEQLVSPMILEGLRAVRALDPGRSGVTEGKPVEPAIPADVDNAISVMPPAIAAIIALLRHTGARPSEILGMRPCDLDRSGDVWAFSPPRHKTAWKGKTRTIYLGPEAKAALAPWLLGTAPEEIIFSPARSEDLRNRRRSEERATPRWPSHLERNEAKRSKRRKLPPADRYDARALALAVRRACKRAKVKPFAPYQLRHLKAVELRQTFGLETVRAVLGHSFKAMSDHYSKAADAVLAAKAAAAAG